MNILRISFAEKKHLSSFLLMAFLSVVLAACAGSAPSQEDPAPKMSADEVRARAGGSYAALDDDLEGSVQESTAKKSAPKKSASKKKAASTSSNDSYIQVDKSLSLLDQLAKTSCPDGGYIRGQGVADDPRKALLLAQKNISEQIQSDISSKTSMSVIENEYGKDVTSESSYSMKSMVRTRLKNAQDAKAIATFKKKEEYGVVACMSKVDAALPFMQEFELLQDSTYLLSKMFAEQKHPVEKNDAYKRAKNTFARLLAAEHILNGLGMDVEEDVKDVFVAMQQEYNNFRSQYAFYFHSDWDDQEFAKLGRLVFQRLSMNYAVKDAVCENGLRLTLYPSSVSCRDGAWGVLCSVDLEMDGASCQGESYFKLHAKIDANGLHGVADSMERLEGFVKSGDWFNEWKDVLDKWRLE